MEIVHTYRFAAHSKGDDFRDSDEIEEWKKKDLLLLRKKLKTLRLMKLKKLFV